MDTRRIDRPQDTDYDYSITKKAQCEIKPSQKKRSLFPDT